MSLTRVVKPDTIRRGCGSGAQFECSYGGGAWCYRMTPDHDLDMRKRCYLTEWSVGYCDSYARVDSGARAGISKSAMTRAVGGVWYG